jgi:catechol 2,3-dioxygenase-like lactoylglutathione lyase family enzyme
VKAQLGPPGAAGQSAAQKRELCVPDRHIALTTLVVRDYDEAIAFYRDKIGFELIEDTPLGGSKRWVVMSPDSDGAALLLARADGPAQVARVGDQTGGRVGFFLYTDDFERDHAAMIAKGVRFIRPPVRERYGVVAVWEDLYGNRWDLLQPSD